MTKPDPAAKDQIQILRPDWDIPGVDAGFTLRTGGVSKPPYDSLNLAMHVGDDPDDVRENRRRLVEYAGLPEEPRWLKQVHGNRVVHASEVERDITEADAVWTDQPGQVCAVMVADCVPILLAAKDGSCVAAIHAGWRGLAAGVIETTLSILMGQTPKISVLIGPHVQRQDYPVNASVIKAMESMGIRPICYRVNQTTALLDLRQTTLKILEQSGVFLRDVFPTMQAQSLRYSFRHQRTTGRNVALITTML